MYYIIQYVVLYHVIHCKGALKMSEELKNRSFRISDETTEKFRQLCSDFDNQNIALNALISAYEVQQAKTLITERQTDIGDYDTHLQALQSAFLHSLELNENAETRIRQEFQRQLDSKDNTIADLQERIKQAESDIKTAGEQVTTITVESDTRVKQAMNELDSMKKELVSANQQITELSESLTAVKSQIADKQQIIDNLNQQLSNVKEMTKKAETAEARAIKAESELKDVKSELDGIKHKYTADIKELKQQLTLQAKEAEADKKEALADLKEKYITELDELRKKVQSLTEENFNIKSAKCD